MKDILFLALLLITGVPKIAGQPATVSSLRFLGHYEIPFDQTYENVQVGGLSGIDYDRVNNVYYAISDDRGEHGNVRVYTLKIKSSAAGISGVEILKLTYLLDPQGKRYGEKSGRNNPDPESLRWNEKTKELVWSSEGERALRRSGDLLLNPFIQTADANGKYRSSFTLPPNLQIRRNEHGPRQNSALEGITFDENYQNLYVALEEPLFHDGPRADTVKSNAVTRLYQFDVSTQKCIGQFGYKLEDVAHTPVPKDKYKINGISEILYLNDRAILVIERSFSTGRLGCTVRLFLTDFSRAENVADLSSLKGISLEKLARKKLLLNLDDLGMYIDNIEGVTLGPKLPNGHQTLILISDNNFNWFQKTQLLLFEIIP